MQISDKIRALTAEAERALAERFRAVDEIAMTNTEHVLDVFRENRVSEAMFSPSTGYGYGDRGRDTADKIVAELFGAEAGFVRTAIISGTHALTVGLFGLLRPGDTLLSVTGAPYDTLREVIGMDAKNGDGSLADFGVSYKEVPMTTAGTVDLPAVKAAIEATPSVKVVFLQRSKGYLDRRTLSVAEIGEVVSLVKSISKDIFVMVDNCYGEFTETSEPTALGVDLMVGSLIKNPGGGMAETGGYLSGTARAVELAGYRLSSPGVGIEAGASLGQTRNILKGFFYAPHTVAEAIKTATLAAYLFEKLGYEVSPGPFEVRHDIIQTIKCKSAEGLIRFCRGIQSASPIDSHVTPEPWPMPGYADPVIMAAGAFTGGSSIELSADGPVRPPYIAYLQGGLTYESARLGIMRAADEMLK
ncbi:MAG: methionine gamma-lyase family protein [Clostridia bacterium]|nr:methionine gamma-lyase family protein [Clostridia bacterium]